MLEMKQEKKFLEHVKSYKGGVKAVHQKSKVELLFSVGASLTVIQSSRQDILLMTRYTTI